ncbi:MAG: hypothetical protein ACRELB_06520, partial [Polyangiaceae bacterium]
RSERRVMLLPTVAVALAVAVGGGITLGRTLASRTASTAHPAAAAVMADPAPVVPQPVPAAAPAPTPEPSGTAEAPAVTGAPGTPRATIAKPAPAAHRVVWRGRPRAAPVTAKIPASSSGPAKDSLEEAIRKSIGAP